MCTHHWIIESAFGPTSLGVYHWCGERREFRNSCEPESWQGNGRHLTSPERLRFLHDNSEALRVAGAM